MRVALRACVLIEGRRDARGNVPRERGAREAVGERHRAEVIVERVEHVTRERREALPGLVARRKIRDRIASLTEPREGLAALDQVGPGEVA